MRARCASPQPIIKKSCAARSCARFDAFSMEAVDEVFDDAIMLPKKNALHKVLSWIVEFDKELPVFQYTCLALFTLMYFRLCRTAARMWNKRRLRNKEEREAALAAREKRAAAREQHEKLEKQERKQKRREEKLKKAAAEAEDDVAMAAVMDVHPPAAVLERKKRRSEAVFARPIASLDELLEDCHELNEAPKSKAEKKED